MVIMKKSKGHKFKILYCSMALTFGGEQKQLAKILRYFNWVRYESIVCCIRNFGYIEEAIRNFACKFVCLEIRNRYGLFKEVWRLRKIIKKYEINLIHTAIFGSEFSPLITAMIMRIPAVVFLTTTYDLEARLAAASTRRTILHWKLRAFYMVHAILARLVKVRYVAYSETIKESATKNLHLPPEHISILPLGLNLDEFDGRLPQQKAAMKVKDG